MLAESEFPMALQTGKDMTLRITVILVVILAHSACWSEDSGMRVELRRYLNGRATITKSIELDAEANAEIAAAVQECLSESDREMEDRASYAPSMIIESDKFRIDLRSTRTVISRRESKKDVWRQMSRKPTKADQKLREIVSDLTRSTDSSR